MKKFVVGLSFCFLHCEHADNIRAALFGISYANELPREGAVVRISFLPFDLFSKYKNPLLHKHGNGLLFS